MAEVCLMTLAEATVDTELETGQCTPQCETEEEKNVQVRT
jgi:hypothetical protein